MSETVSVYKCSDGTDFPVAWKCEDDARLIWSRDESHWPDPLKPIDWLVWEGTQARERAFSEAGLPVPTSLRKFLVPHGFVYLQSPDSSEEGIDDLSRRHGGPAAVWEEHCRPRAQEACARLQQAHGGERIADLVELCDYAWANTMVAARVVRTQYLRLSKFLTDRFGPEGEAWTATLTHGFPNATVDAAQAQWELAQLASGSPQTRELIVGGDWSSMRQLSHVEDGSKFQSAFDDFIRRFGWRGENWEVGSLTWKERPDRAMDVIRRMIMDGTPSPEVALSEAAQRREELKVDLEGRLWSNSARLREFLDLLSAAEPYPRVREDRALWQLNAVGSLRSALLRRGAGMVQDGSIGQAEDILYLLPEEIENTAHGDLSDLVMERTAERERWSHLRPPEQVGAVETSTQPEVSGVPAAADEIRGLAASRGVATGPARIIRDLAEADRLMSGDVLVCRTTSPPWTVLFTRAIAVVADAGSVLSHTAIAAREFGIPCVVAARGATEWIRDGMLVTVDGDLGVVRLDG